jgi:sulfur-carrier protein
VTLPQGLASLETTDDDRRPWAAAGASLYNPSVPVIRLPEALRRRTRAPAILEVAGTTVGEALEEALIRYPELRLRLVNEAGVVHSYLALFHNEVQLRRAEAGEVRLDPGDTLTVLEAVGGGAG